MNIMFKPYFFSIRERPFRSCFPTGWKKNLISIKIIYAANSTHSILFLGFLFIIVDHEQLCEFTAKFLTGIRLSNDKVHLVRFGFLCVVVKAMASIAY